MAADWDFLNPELTDSVLRIHYNILQPRQKSLITTAPEADNNHPFDSIGRFYHLPMLFQT